MTDAELMNPRDNVTPQLVIGLAVMAAGVLMTLDIAGFVHARDYLRYWPVVLIVIGALNLASTGGRRGASTGVVQLAIGIWFLLISTRVLPRHAWVLFWPLLLMFGGAMLVLHTIRRDHEPADSRELISMTGILGGSNRQASANPFRGGELVAMMGGGRIDLRQAVIPPGGQAVIDILCVMGGYEIVVPDSWVVDDRTTTFLGGNGNETRPRADANATLVLRGFLMLGGCAIKN
jgi:predicted membrane protein